MTGPTSATSTTGGNGSEKQFTTCAQSASKSLSDFSRLLSRLDGKLPKNDYLTGQVATKIAARIARFEKQKMGEHNYGEVEFTYSGNLGKSISALHNLDMRLLSKTIDTVLEAAHANRGTHQLAVDISAKDGKLEVAFFPSVSLSGPHKQALIDAADKMNGEMHFRGNSTVLRLHSQD